MRAHPSKYISRVWLSVSLTRIKGAHRYEEVRSREVNAIYGCTFCWIDTKAGVSVGRNIFDIPQTYGLIGAAWCKYGSFTRECEGVYGLRVPREDFYVFTHPYIPQDDVVIDSFWWNSVIIIEYEYRCFLFGNPLHRGEEEYAPAVAKYFPSGERARAWTGALW